MELRSDHALIRHLSRAYAPALGAEYDRLSLFLIPDDLSVLISQEQNLLATIGEGEDRLHLPFPDLLLDFPAGAASAMRPAFPAWPDRGRMWIRVRTVTHALRSQDTVEFISRQDLQRLPAPEGWAVTETWEEKTSTGSFHLYPDVAVLPLTTETGDFQSYLYDYPNKDHRDGRLVGRLCNILQCTLAPHDRRRSACAFSDLIMSAAARVTILALAYITAGVSLTVRVRPEQRAQVKPHVARDKPWLTPRTHYILVDPARVRDYGYPSAHDPYGSHRSPAPHARRGHWRRLPEGFRKQQTWVRETFVGMTEWRSAGKAYKIIDWSGTGLQDRSVDTLSRDGRKLNKENS
jgi:hypothetical protein